ncbi:UNVERIFIED_CONTAM: hypothetical protein RMT77_013562 [Armadillidium vulgare]|nr:ATPase inhibitor mai-2, mitochondrial [Armadillidium vulgare]RXG72740.1 ATPase inhibitor mai-2, mitochondrial [Armadillidium vulgare]
MSLQRINYFRRIPAFQIAVRAMSGGEAGSGAGKGGGTGGTIRDAGGAFGKREATHEEQYFRKLQQEQLKDLKKGLEKEVDFHEEQIKVHKKALERHKERLEKLEGKE